MDTLPVVIPLEKMPLRPSETINHPKPSETGGASQAPLPIYVNDRPNTVQVFGSIS